MPISVVWWPPASAADDDTTPRPDAVSIDAVLEPVLHTWQRQAERNGIALLHASFGLQGMSQPLLRGTCSAT